MAHALSVHFQCNSLVLPDASVEHHVEPETGVRYAEARVEVTRDQVEEFFGDYHCSCVAISGKDSRFSRNALVTYACEYKKTDRHHGDSGGTFGVSLFFFSFLEKW